MAAIIRPARKQDFAALIDEPLPYRVKAFAVEDDGKLLGVGGFAYQPGGTIAAFVLKGEGAERYPLALHRAGRYAMSEAQREGFRRVVALAETNNPAAERWLQRLGFELVMTNGERAWVWERK